MGRLTRRRFLAAAGAGVAGVAARGAYGQAPGKRKPLIRFTHGVASGDPLSDRVILWTRALPRSRRPTKVNWIIATDPALRDVVKRGRASTRRRNDWTVKVDATGLKPGRTYYFRFKRAGVRSPIGRTRTAPTGAVDRTRLAVLTCADFSRGLYNAYERVSERDDIDAVVHLGDYIYEGFSENRVRKHEPQREILTLADYRTRYALYRSDPKLARLHARHPMIWVWDDHETVNGTWRGGADSHNPSEDGDFEARKAAATKAALEWLPIRPPDPAVSEKIYRRFSFGDLVDLVMIDTRRIGRDEQGEPNVNEDFFTQTGEFTDPARQILGAEQEAWLLAELRDSDAAWRLIGNQVVFSPLKVVGAPEASGQSVFANVDQWDGYAPARDRILTAIAERDDVVILTGDVHASFAFEVTRDPNNPAAYDPVTGRGSEAVEFVTPSISSAGDPQPGQTPRRRPTGDGPVERLLADPGVALQGPNPHLKYVESLRNGYLIVDVDRERLRAEFWLVPAVTRETSEQEMARAFTVPRGESRLVG